MYHQIFNAGLMEIVLHKLGFIVHGLMCMLMFLGTEIVFLLF